MLNSVFVLRVHQGDAAGEAAASTGTGSECGGGGGGLGERGARDDGGNSDRLRKQLHGGTSMYSSSTEQTLVAKPSGRSTGRLPSAHSVDVVVELHCGATDRPVQ